MRAFDGHFIYFGTQTARLASRRTTAEWLSGFRMDGRPHRSLHGIDADVVVAYTEFATGYYRKGDLSCHRAFIPANDLCDENRDVASARLIEVWIDESERRTWFLFEASRAK